MENETVEFNNANKLSLNVCLLETLQHKWSIAKSDFKSYNMDSAKIEVLKAEISLILEIFKQYNPTNKHKEEANND
jgi:hypothetical protein